MIDINNITESFAFLSQKIKLRENDGLREIFEKCFSAYDLGSESEEDIAKDDFFQLFSKNVVFENKDKIPPLFRYSPANYYNIRNLETETLMLSSIGNMNDIFEGLSGEVDADIINSLDELKDVAYIKSFSEKKNDFLMWSHYGDNYAGMCVEYDFSKLNEVFLYHLFPVIYSNKRYSVKTFGNAVEELYELKKANKEGNYPDLYDSLMDILALFLRKSDVWDYENEWRIVATYPQIHNPADDFYNKGKDDRFPLYDIDSKTISVKNCIKAVYIGPKTQKTQREHIKEICAKLAGVKVYQLKISKSKYAFEEIECNSSDECINNT